MFSLLVFPVGSISWHSSGLDYFPVCSKVFHCPLSLTFHLSAFPHSHTPGRIKLTVRPLNQINIRQITRKRTRLFIFLLAKQDLKVGGDKTQRLCESLIQRHPVTHQLEKKKKEAFVLGEYCILSIYF